MRLLACSLRNRVVCCLVIVAWFLSAAGSSMSSAAPAVAEKCPRPAAKVVKTVVEPIEKSEIALFEEELATLKSVVVKVGTSNVNAISSCQKKCQAVARKTECKAACKKNVKVARKCSRKCPAKPVVRRDLQIDIADAFTMLSPELPQAAGSRIEEPVVAEAAAIPDGPAVAEKAPRGEIVVAVIDTSNIIDASVFDGPAVAEKAPRLIRHQGPAVAQAAPRRLQLAKQVVKSDDEITEKDVVRLQEFAKFTAPVVMPRLWLVMQLLSAT